jgi:hypothetical protein
MFKPPDQIAKLVQVGVTDIDVAGRLELVGQTKPVAAKLRATRIGDNKILVTTREPIVVNSNDFSLQAGVEALRAIVGLNFLSASAPVSFSLVLNAQL